MTNNDIVTDCNPLWFDLLGKAKQTFSSQTYDSWFAPLKALSVNNGSFTIEAPNNFFKEWIVHHYRDFITKTLSEISGKTIHLDIHIRSDQAPFEYEMPKKRIHLKRKMPISFGNNLNKNYTFDSFVVGPSNRFAHAASTAVAISPAQAYNPLFIYGGVGLGKTHLMHAIGQQIRANHPDQKVYYVSSEEFTNQLIDAIRNKNTASFRAKYRSVDAILIDDIHFVSGKEQTQEEFFHTFNSLYDAHKQIVLSSDRPPKEISRLEERLVSRFEWGLVTDIQIPDIETRVAILKQKAAISNYDIMDDLAFFLASRIKTNIRKLEGALVKVVSYASLNKTQPTVSLAEELLQDILIEDKVVTVEMIHKKVAEHYDLRASDMTSKRRPAGIAFPRQIAMYLARELTNNSLKEIGEAFGGRDHTTVLHAYKMLDEKIHNDFKIRKLINHLKQKVKE